jgi:monofunctional biosynthetic peptidoglycan transglycosylase
MAAVLPNPKRMRVEPASPYVKERKVWILKNMMNLSGIAYYEAPQSKAAQDSIQIDSALIFDIPYIDLTGISNIGISIQKYNEELSTKEDSTASDSISQNNFNY